MTKHHVKVHRIDPGCFLVQDGEKRYSATLVKDGSWWIVDQPGQVVPQKSSVYRCVEAAIIADAVANKEHP